MFIRFFEINTNTYEGVYRVSDFINRDTGDFWCSEDTNRPQTFIKDGLYQFDATDDLSELIVMVDEFDYPNRVTHVVASDRTRTVAYAVDSVEYINDKQVKYRLIEDNYLSHIAQVNSSRVLLTRSNDESLFLEHDVADLAYTRDRTTVDLGLYDYTGKWVVYTLAINIDDANIVYLKFKDLEPDNYERFSAFIYIKQKYPEVVTKTPTAIDYFGKIVSVGSSLYQAQYNYSLMKIKWEEIPISIPASSIMSTLFMKKAVIQGFGGIGPSVKLISGDMLTLNLAFPVADNIFSYGFTGTEEESQYGYNHIPCADRLESFKIGNVDMSSYIISKRIITGIAFNEQGTYRPADADASRIYVNNNNLVMSHNWSYGENGWLNVFVPIIKNMSSINNLQFTLSSVLQHSPFRNYYLSVFGQNIPIKTKLSGKSIVIKSSISSTDWSVVIYADNTNNVIWSGKINADMPYSLDKFQEFLAQNSTYATSKWVNTVLGGGIRTAKGAIGGFVAGGGNPVGAMVGGLTGAVGIAQDMANYALQEKAMKDAPDTIKGDGNDFGAIEISPYGIYFYYMTPAIDALNIMKTEYYAKGFPLNTITTIDDLDFEDNDIYGKCKIVFGRCVDMINNFHTTSRITERLRNGIVLLEDQYE